MKKISLLTQIIFHTVNLVLIILYIFPGSILGWFIYEDFKKQPQITSDFVISSKGMNALGFGDSKSRLLLT